MKSLEVVQIMCQYSKEFLTGKITTDVWPLLLKLLKTDSLIENTQNEKLQ